jgi:hypothetical protein
MCTPCCFEQLQALAAEKRAQAAVDTAAAAHEAELRRARAAAAAAADTAAAAQHEAAQLRTQLELARTTAATTVSTRKVSVPAAAPAAAVQGAVLTTETAGAAVVAALRGVLASRNARHPLRALRRLIGAPASTGTTSNSNSNEEWSVSYDELCDALEDLQLPLSRAQQEGLCQYLDPDGLDSIQVRLTAAQRLS